MSALAEKLDDLPQRLRQNLAEATANFVVAIRTQFRDNPDMPYCWLVVTMQRIVIASTHRRAIHYQFQLHEINELRINLAQKTVSLLPMDPARADKTLPVPKATDDELRRFHQRSSAIISNTVLV